MRKVRSEAERFWSKVDVSGDCWIWMAGRNRNGYGRFGPYQRNQVMAHHWAYEALVGPIPEGMSIDHLCGTPACVRPEHLEPVPPSENARRTWTCKACGAVTNNGVLMAPATAAAHQPSPPQITPVEAAQTLF